MGAPSAGDDKTMAVLSHAGQILCGFLVPLIIYLTKKDKSPFIRHHATEGLNWSITVIIAYVAVNILARVGLGLIGLLTPLIWLGSLVLVIVASIAANKGEYYRYPFALRLIK